MSSVNYLLVDASSGSSATVSKFGGRVLSWQCQGRERIFMPAIGSEKVRDAPHGGIPVLFPQFGFFGNGRKHGVVRDMEWVLGEHGEYFVLMRCRLSPGEDVPDADLRLRVELEPDALTVDLSVTNCGAIPISFTCGLHTYIRIVDAAKAQVSGLERAEWQDALQDMQTIAPAGVVLNGPVNVDRVYVNAPQHLYLTDADTRLSINQSGFADTVVWNPGPELAKGLRDLQGDDWRNFLCVEAAQISPPVELAAGATWNGAQRLHIADA